jgi:hypothetical protein
MRQLSKEEIVSHKIAQVWQTPWKIVTHEDGSRDDHISDTYIELDSGIYFKLEPGIFFEDDEPKKFADFHIFETDITELQLIKAEYIDKSPVESNGLVILDVVASPYWPTLGLLLENNTVLVSDAYGIQFAYFGAFEYAVDDSYLFEDLVSFWDLSPLNLCTTSATE